MTTYLVKRLFQAVLVMWAAASVVFVLMRLAGSPVDLILPPEASDLDRQRLTLQLGLDQPILVQYATFLENILHGDFGHSYWQDRPALSIVLERFPATIELATAAILLSLLIAVPLGAMSAIKKGGTLDNLTMTAALFGHAMPTFWLALLLILIFSVHLHLFPSFGRGSWQHLVLPTISLATYSIARLARITRSSMLEVLDQDYIRTARAKGLSAARVIWVHAFRNAALPIVTLAALEFGVLLGGTVLTELVFAWPGLGWLAMEAVSRRDFPLVQAIILTVATTFILINLVTDILYAVINPRIRVN
jgi:ABC-type dipeptide/oligopeptide/nickel transport system permease component